MKGIGKYIVRATVAVALVFIGNLYGQDEAVQSFDQRCLWVVRSNITNVDLVDNLIKFAQLNRFNNLIVQVRGRGDALYNSEFVSKSILLQDPAFDPLDYLIKKAHASGIMVHAWVNVYLVWSDKRLPDDKTHILNRHPDWLDITEAGRVQPGELVQNMDELREGHEGLYLSPGHPDVPDYLLKVFEEIISKYDIDGLHLDYIRYQDADFGRNPVARRIYEQYNGIDPLVLLSNQAEWSGNDRQFASRLKKWSDYRRYLITDLIKQTHLLVENIRPDCILSAAVKPNLYQARDQFFQEWDVWLAAGYLDWVFPMNYTREISDFANNIEIIYDNLPPKYRDRIIMGIATYNQDAADVVDKLHYSRITRFKGICLFSYNTFDLNPAYARPVFLEINK
ncbi:MAG: family 10 glycosylhydrolase [Candidatus Neomarinimicrobiota bacterium]